MSILQYFEEQKSGTLPESYRNLTREQMEARIREIKEQLGDKLFIPGHHYQKDEVIQFADATGDSLQLAQICADNKEAEHIVFCGVHFMAETADILTTDASESIFTRYACRLFDGRYGGYIPNGSRMGSAWKICSGRRLCR